MTTPSTQRKAGPLLGTGVQTTWPFAFKVFAATDIAVTIADSNGIENVLSYGVDYSVTLNPNQETSPGGTVTYPIAGTPLPAGSRLVIVGNLPYDQPLDLPSGGNFSPLALENQLDRATMQIQQIDERLDRALVLPVSVPGNANPVLPNPQAQAVIGWDVNGTGLQNYDLPDLFSGAVYADWIAQTFTGNGVTTVYILQRAPGSVGNCDVSISGVTQVPNVDYTLSGNTISFTSAPAAGLTILVRYGSAASQVASTFSVESQTATSMQTVFTLASLIYNPGSNSLAVYVNGARLTAGADYLETDINEVTFTMGLSAGDHVQFVAGRTINDVVGAEGVSYQPAGAGAVATNVQAKLRETVSVRDFGAVGDGVADDTAAINSAIAYAKATSGIKCIYFPTGNYLITASIDARGNFGTGLELWGARATITSTGNFPALRLNGRVPDTPPEVRMMAYVHGFVFQGPGKANTSSIGVEVQRGANVIVKDCQMYNYYRGLYCFGNLISSYHDLYIYGCAIGIEAAPDGIEFAPNDLHFKSCQVVNNTRAVRAINFPNGAMTFEDCELEGNNLTGNVADSVRVIEFFNAGKVTLNGCHVEANPGQFNIYFDGNNNAHLNVIGCEVIPGDSCGTVLYMANATGSPSLTVIGSRVTNNVQQIFLSSGVKAFVIGTFAGSLSGTLTNVTWLRDSRVVLGRNDPLAGGTGIIFPATQNPSTDPNTLDDYKEGTWTPTVIGTVTAGTATYGYQNAKYTKIGRLVFVECLISWSAGTGSGELKIDGLPFTVSNSTPSFPSATIGRINDVTLIAGATPQAYFEPGQTKIILNQSISGGGPFTAINYDASGLIIVSGTYTV